MNEISASVLAAIGPGQSAAVEELPVSYVEMDAHGVVIRANRMTRALHSSHAGELIGSLAWEMMPTEEQDLSCAAFVTAMETGIDPGVSRRSIYSSEETFRVFDLHRNLIRDADGKPTGMRVVSVDVTEAVTAQLAAEKARQWLECVFASIPDAVIVTDALGFIRSVNPATEELLGWKAGELIGKEFGKALSLITFDAGSKTRQDLTMNLDQRAKKIAILLDRQRRELWAEISTAPIVDKEQGLTIGVVIVLRQMEAGG